jgi:hypothetical protein
MQWEVLPEIIDLLSHVGHPSHSYPPYIELFQTMLHCNFPVTKE